MVPKNIFKYGLFSLLFTSAAANAVPVLQLGPDPADAGASYDPVTETWVVSGDSSFSFSAYNLGPDLTAYIVLASIPELMTDVFDVTVSDDSGALSLFASGHGTPPFTDPNSLAPHDIYATYSEIYTLTFDGPLTTVFDTQPGETGSAQGYAELITVNLLSLDPALTGIHIDMFTMDADGQVTHFAPFSHDAEWMGVVPVPAAVWLFGSGLIALAGVTRRRRSL